MRPVLLVHGFGSSFEHGWVETGWPDILGDTGREVIGVDLLGHGDAAKPHDPAAYTRGLLESVLEMLPADGSAVDAIGFSLGAAVLMRLAIEEPDRFARLVLIGVGELTLRTGAAAGESGATGSRVLVQLMETERNDAVALDACIRRPQQPFTDAELATITAPTLVVTSDEDELAGSPQPLVDALPNARLIVPRGIDHFQTPREFASIDAAMQFLDAG